MDPTDRGTGLPDGGGTTLVSLFGGRQHGLRRTLGDELDRLRMDVLRMGDLVDGAIATAARALLERDVERGREVVDGDAAVNALHRAVRETAFEILLRQAPVAGDLREVIALLHIATELERIGDHAVSVAKQAIAIAALPALDPPVDIGVLAGYCVEQVRDGLSAVVARDIERARAVAVRDDRLDRVYHRLHDELVDRMQEDPRSIPLAVTLISMAHHLERIGDRVINLAEGLVFLETGEIVDLG